MLLDMRHHHSIGNGRHLVQVTKIRRQHRIIGNSPDIAFEMTDIDRIKPDQRCKEAPVCFGQPVAHQIAPVSQTQLHSVQRVKQADHRFFIGGSCCGKASAIDTIIDVFIDVAVHRLDVGTKLFRPVIILVASEPVKGGIEHANDLG